MKINITTLTREMNFLAWIVCIGILVKAGAILISYFVSISNAEAAHDLFRGMDLSAYRDYSLGHYSFIVGYQVLLLIGYAFIAFLMTQLLSKINIDKPFNVGLVKLMQQICYAMLAVWGIAMVHNIHSALLERSADIVPSHISSEALFLAGVVYVLAQMFKRGVELQHETELTI